MTRDDLLARLALDTNDLATWTDLVRLDARASRPTLTKPEAKVAGKRDHTVKIGVKPTQWPHLVEAARVGVCSWHSPPSPGDNMLRGIVLIRPAADSPTEAPAPTATRKTRTPRAVEPAPAAETPSVEE